MNKEEVTQSAHSCMVPCFYCGFLLPKEPEEVRRVFERTPAESHYWMVYRCANSTCQRRTFVRYFPTDVLEQRKKANPVDHQDSRNSPADPEKCGFCATDWSQTPANQQTGT